MNQNKVLRLADFDVSPERGFLPKEDPLSVLPNNLTFLDELGKNLPDLVESGKLAGEVQKLPDDTSFVYSLSSREIQLAWQRYTFIQSAYVHSLNEVLIPFNIARPVYALSRILNKPPILSYDGYTLNNWRRKNTDGPIAVDNLELTQSFIRDPEQSWFVLIHVDIENQAGLAIRNIREAVLAAERFDESALESALLDINLSLANIINVMRRMLEGTSPDTYHRIRKWIMSFKGVLYEGVPELEGKLQFFHGQTGAQTSIFQSLEAGLEMPPLGINKLATFLKEMRKYMLRGHREFIFKLESTSQVRESIISKAPHLSDLYNNCVDKICDFLDIHYGYAIKFIFEKTDNPEGTGGSDFMKYLKGRLDERRLNAYIRKGVY